MKAFTERNPKALGLVALSVMAVVVLGVVFFNRNLFASGYQVTARFPNAAGIGKGTEVLVAGVHVGRVSAVTITGNAVDATMTIDGGVDLPQHTTASVKVETLLGVVDVSLDPVSGWARPLTDGTLITDTSVPTEFYQLQNTAGHLFERTDARALNSVVRSLASITRGKQHQVAQIIDGLGKLTSTVDQRSGQVSQLIDSANTVVSALAGRDQQLSSVIDNLNVVAGGLASHSADLGNLIDNVDAVATNTNSLVSQDSPQLNSLLQHVHSILGVVGQHQVDLAQAVSYLSGALRGFASVGYSGPNDTPNSWANIYANVVTVLNAYGVIGPCGVFDQALNQVLGPDPLACAGQTGPLPGEPPASGTAGTGDGSTGGGPAPRRPPTPTAAAGAPAGAPATPSPGAPSSGLGGLSQLLGPLLGGGG